MSSIADEGTGTIGYTGNNKQGKHAAHGVLWWVIMISNTSGSNQVDLEDLEPFSSIGKQVTVLDGHVEADLLFERGKGCLTHMWFGGDWPLFERTRLRVYVDDETTPSIDIEVGLGHGYGFGEPNAPWGTEKMGKTGHPSGVYNTHKIPFGTSIRVTAQRSPNAPPEASFWWIIRGVRELPVFYSGIRLPETARLKVYCLDNYVAQPLEEFDLCNVNGAGAVYQMAMAGESLRNNGDWFDISYLEAVVRGYFNGRSEAILLSSGLEDYFLGTYYFNRGLYANPLAGLTHLDPVKNAFSAYRFHDNDPLFFNNGLRLTCRCGEELNGAMLHNPPPTRFSSYVWIYHW